MSNSLSGITPNIVIKAPGIRLHFFLEEYFTAGVSEDERRQALSLAQKSYERDNRNLFLLDTCLSGIFGKWIEEEQTDYRLYRWLGVYQSPGTEHLKKALELKPDDQISITELVDVYLRGIGYVTHELSCSALLCPVEEAIEDLKHAQHLIGLIDDKYVQKNRQGLCTKYTELIDVFAKYDQLKPKIPFFEWAANEKGLDYFSKKQ